MTSSGLGSCIVFICKVGIICHLPSRVMELVVIYINHPEVVLVGRSMLRDWSLPLSIFPFPVLSSAHDSIPTSHRWISLWSSLSQTNIIRVKMVRGTVAFGFIIVKTIWPRCLGEYYKYMCIHTHTHTPSQVHLTLVSTQPDKCSGHCHHHKAMTLSTPLVNASLCLPFKACEYFC